MKIKQVEIRNFRSIKDVSFNLLSYMVFVGKNNSGKSNLMVALNAFFSCDVGSNDFRKQKGQQSKKLSIIVHFYQLNKREQKIYTGKLKNEGEKDEQLVLRLRADLSKDGKVNTIYEYLSQSLKLDNTQAQARYGPLFEDTTYKSVPKLLEHPHTPQEFKKQVEAFVEKKGQKRLTKQEYTDLRDDFVKDLLKKHPSLGKESFEAIKITSRNCSKMLGNFFFIPAVQDVEEETRYTAKGKKSLNHLMNYVLDQMQDSENRALKEREIRSLLTELYHLEEEGSEINKLKGMLNEQLALFDNSELTFDTRLPNLSKMIRDSLRIYIDDGIKTEVQYKGHGLQRYFMVVLFKAWSEKLKEQKREKKEASISTYFSIEEPELFLHPQFQRMMRIYLQKIAEDEEHQIILNTHSPHFIEFNDIFQVAKVLKTDDERTTIVQPLEFDEKGNQVEKEMVCT
ncbi:MAG: ATP-binding protein [Candidatus Lokiarchaeota archaeon]|nr:ATP-binding protein [Candidatus Lokiarchaeota archaeon]